VTTNLEYHVRQAKNGNKQSLETVVERIQERIYGLALRMLGNNEDAEDETQEILIKVITHLSNFREESAFSSWVYRVASNHLLTIRKRKSEREAVTFDFLEEMILADTDKTYPLTVSGPERDLLAEEARLGCMQTVLACLDKKTRITYILGNIFGVTSKEGAYIFDITAEAFRKRLSRGRKCIAEFMMKHCGLINENNTCRCLKQAGKKPVSIQAIPAGRPLVKKDGVVKGRAEAVAHLKELSEIDRTAAMFRRYPQYQSPDSFTNIVKDLIRSGKYTLFGPY
jgi:RNA polymerase sigma factor (sigma-70 family)